MKKVLVIAVSLTVIAGALFYAFYVRNGASTNTADVQKETQQQANQGPQETAVESEEPSDTSRQVAPGFTLPGINGGQISLSDYKGKPVVLDFWASWCPNCRRDMPVMNSLYEKYDGQVEVIAINMQEPENVAKKFFNGEGFSFRGALDATGNVTRDYGVGYTNTHVLIDKDGNIIDKFLGDITEDHFKQLLDI